MHDTLLMQIPYARHELSKQSPGGIVLQISVIEDVVKQLAPRCILEHDAIMPVGFLHLV